MGNLLDVQQIDLSIEHSFVADKFVFWHDSYCNSIEGHDGGLGEVEEERLPALPRMVIDARIAGGVTDFDEHAAVVECHVGDIPGGAEIPRGLPNNEGFHVF